MRNCGFRIPPNYCFFRENTLHLTSSPFGLHLGCALQTLNKSDHTTFGACFYNCTCSQAGWAFLKIDPERMGCCLRACDAAKKRGELLDYLLSRIRSGQEVPPFEKPLYMSWLWENLFSSAKIFSCPKQVEVPDSIPWRIRLRFCKKKRPPLGPLKTVGSPLDVLCMIGRRIAFLKNSDGIPKKGRYKEGG